jgi:hypothetical protein
LSVEGSAGPLFGTATTPVSGRLTRRSHGDEAATPQSDRTIQSHACPIRLPIARNAMSRTATTHARPPNSAAARTALIFHDKRLERLRATSLCAVAISFGAIKNELSV